MNLKKRLVHEKHERHERKPNHDIEKPFVFFVYFVDSYFSRMKGHFP